MSNATTFLGQKLQETVDEYGVPALASAVVGEGGAKTASGQRGIRKSSASGAENVVQPTDRFNLGSVSKVVTGLLMGKLIEAGVGGLAWETTIGDVFPELTALPGFQAKYAAATIQQLLTHTAGMPYTPSGDNVNDWKTWTAADLTSAKLIARRLQYVANAVVDPPLYDPGSGCIYEGGGIICAAMAEKRTGQRYELLVQQYVYDPLGMTSSAFGQTSAGPLDGTWLHAWNAAELTVVPDPETHLASYSWHPRTPVGGICMSAADMASFLTEQVTASPVICSTETRRSMQTAELTPSFVRGGWAAGASTFTSIAHDGDIGVAYASAVVQLDKPQAYAALCNMNKFLAVPAISEMHEVSRFMLANWTLFDSSRTGFVGCAHPAPALIMSGAERTLFARKHDGSVWRKHSADNGSHWSDAVRYPASILNSGVAATGSRSGDKRYAFGRGLDNRIWFAHSFDAGSSWQGWVPIGTGEFLTGCAASASDSGSVVHVAATGMDKRMYTTRSNDSGSTWSEWVPVGAGVFTAAPALAVRPDGEQVYAFGRGLDWKIWRNRSDDGGHTWQPHWNPIGMGFATSSPAAAVSGGGWNVHVVSRGADRRMWLNKTLDGGETWLPHWKPIGDGTFTSAPALQVDAGGSKVDIAALGGDFHLYDNHSPTSGDDWGDWRYIPGPSSEFYV